MIAFPQITISYYTLNMADHY